MKNNLNSSHGECFAPECETYETINSGHGECFAPLRKMYRTIKLASLTFLMFGCAVASEFRPPMSADRGPQRLDMNAERAGDSNWELDMYSVAYARNANKTFVKQGGKTAPLSALIFGKDSFKVAEALTAAVPNGTGATLTQAYSQEFNANLGATVLYPRVTYSETGINFGGKIGYRVLDGKGCVALKVNIPLKTVRMERDNNAESAELGGADVNVIQRDPLAVEQIANGTAVGVRNLDLTNIPVASNMYRVSAVKDLPFNRGGRYGKFIDSIIANPAAAANAQNKVIQIGGGFTYSRTQIADDFRNDMDHSYTTCPIPYSVVFVQDAKNPPMLNSRAMALDNPLQTNAVPAQNLQFNGNNIANAIVDIQNLGLQAMANGVNIGRANDVPHTVQAFPVAPEEGVQYVFSKEVGDPAGNFLIGGQNDHVARDLKALATKGDNLWLVTTHAADGKRLDQVTDDALGVILQRYASESAEQWLFRNGYVMTNDQRTGLGDITINPMFEYDFSDAWQGSVYAHVLIPTGGSRKTGYNAYKARLGNDNHVELGAGATAAWQACSWANVRLDAMAAYALPATEYVNVPFKDATVKGLGPVMGASINYTTIRASLDTTLVHPKASSLATTIGYDFAFKTKNNATLASSKYTFKTLAQDPNSWFGGFWDNGPVGGPVPGFVAKEVQLDTAPLVKDTESISHNVRFESSWHANDHLSIFWGGSTPVWGQNVAKMSTVHGGMNVKF